MNEDATKFQDIRPPHRELVEVECWGRVIQVMAIWGSDGVLPHWTDTDESSVWAWDAFPGGWRPIAK